DVLGDGAVAGEHDVCHRSPQGAAVDGRGRDAQLLGGGVGGLADDLGRAAVAEHGVLDLVPEDDGDGGAGGQSGEVGELGTGEVDGDDHVGILGGGEGAPGPVHVGVFQVVEIVLAVALAGGGAAVAVDVHVGHPVDGAVQPADVGLLPGQV